MEISLTENVEQLSTGEIWGTAIILALLLFLSGFFSGSETALTAASRSRMHTLAKNNNWRAKLVGKLRSDSESLISTILLGNTLINILASSLATSLFLNLFGHHGVLYATIIMTVMVLIFAEVLPKTIAINHADQMALALSPLVRACVVLFSPATVLVQWSVRKILAIFGAKAQTGIGHAMGDEELRGAIDLHGKTGEEERDRSVMLRSILDLAEVDVSEVMTHRKNVVMIDIDQSNSALIDQALNSGYTRIALYKDQPDNIVGVLHAKQLLRAIRAHVENIDEIDIVGSASPPWFIPESTNLLDQLNAFRERREHFALVVDEYGSLMGVVTLEDIIEEIVGEVFDEYDISVPGVRPQSDGSFIVNGSVTIRDLNREFDWHLPDEEAVTVAGLILHEAAQIPDVGQVFTFHGLRFEVLRRQRNQITSVRITSIKKQLGSPAENRAIA